MLFEHLENDSFTRVFEGRIAKSVVKRDTFIHILAEKAPPRPENTVKRDEKKARARSAAPWPARPPGQGGPRNVNSGFGV